MKSKKLQGALLRALRRCGRDLLLLARPALVPLALLALLLRFARLAPGGTAQICFGSLSVGCRVRGVSLLASMSDRTWYTFPFQTSGIGAALSSKQEEQNDERGRNRGPKKVEWSL